MRAPILSESTKRLVKFVSSGFVLVLQQINWYHLVVTILNCCQLLFLMSLKCIRFQISPYCKYAIGIAKRIQLLCLVEARRYKYKPPN